jgi:flagellar assembly protein FliH
MSDHSSQTVLLTKIMEQSGMFVPTSLYSPMASASSPQIDEFARGLAEGQQIANAAFEADRAAFQQLLAAADAFQPDTSAELATLIGEAVVRLVEQIAGRVEIELEYLEQQIGRATALISEAEAARTIWLNPEDYQLLANADLGLAMNVDPDLSRGDMRIDCSDSWIEMGAAFGIEKLRDMFVETGLRP